MRRNLFYLKINFEQSYFYLTIELAYCKNNTKSGRGEFDEWISDSLVLLVVFSLVAQFLNICTKRFNSELTVVVSVGRFWCDDS